MSRSIKQTNVRAKRLYEGLFQVGLVSQTAAPGTHRQLLPGHQGKTVSSLCLSFQDQKASEASEAIYYLECLKLRLKNT